MDNPYKKGTLAHSRFNDYLTLHKYTPLGILKDLAELADKNDRNVDYLNKSISEQWEISFKANSLNRIAREKENNGL